MDRQNAEEVVQKYLQKYDIVITFEKAAEIARLPLATVYDWSSRGLFNSFRSKKGRHVRLHTEAYVRWLVSDTK
jgi:phage terminase Nu1 subunit (DNA packaging protein)